MSYRKLWLAWVIVLCCHAASRAQDQPLRLEQAIELAQKNYPAIRAARAAQKAAEANVELTRVSVTLPHTELLVQENRSTRNNVFGLLLPQARCLRFPAPTSAHIPRVARGAARRASCSRGNLSISACANRKSILPKPSASRRKRKRRCLNSM